mmetsp:Transcript_142388/g.248320  ORF Transcript_142388/g.248320 Transcript_142388/m.248320 type:complete len:933 (-) Transcript_142388:172-2970(-)
MAGMARSFDITVTVGWIKGLPVSENQIQAVWEAFSLPQQTELQRITPIFDAGGDVGMVTWNESFEIQDLVVESDEVECYLEIAFWQYVDPDEEPTAIGFKRIDISDFHKNHAKVLEFPVDIDQQSTPAQAYIQLSTHEKRDAPPIHESEEEMQMPQAEDETSPEVARAEQEQLRRQQEIEEQMRREEEERAEAKAAAELAAIQAERKAAEERAAAAERARREADELAAAKAAAAEKAAQAAKAAEAAEAEQAAKAAEAAAKLAEVVPAAATPDEIVFVTPPQKAAMFRLLLSSFCGMQLQPAAPAQAISRTLSIGESASSLEAVIGSVIDEAEGKEQPEVQSDLQAKLMHDVLAFYLSRLENGRDLIGGVKREVVLSILKLLQLPAELMQNKSSACCMDAYSARLFAFQAAARTAVPLLARGSNGTGKAVFYFGEGRAPESLGIDNAVVRTVPVDGTTQCIDHDGLVGQIQADRDAGDVPTLVACTIGLDGTAFCDHVTALQAVCKSSGLVMHVEGPGLFLMMTDYSEAAKVRAALSDVDMALSLTMPLGQLFTAGEAGLGSLSLGIVRIPGLTAPPPSNVATVADYVGIYTMIKTQGLATIRDAASSKLAEATYLLTSLSSIGCVQLFTDPNNLLNIRFRFDTPGTGSQDLVKANEVNRMLHQMFLQGLESSTDALNTVGLKGEAAGPQYFEYSMLAHDMGIAATDALVDLFQRCSATLQSIITHSGAMQEAIKGIDPLVILPDISKTPLALACFRLIPQFYRTFERLTESHIRDINSINTKLASMLKEEDKAFQGIHIGNQIFIVVSSDQQMSIVFNEEYIRTLVERLKKIVEKMEGDDEILSKIQAEITKRGIEVAEKQIQALKQQEAEQESVIRMLPVIGGFANWLAPAPKSETESLSFDLRTSTLVKQVANSSRQSRDTRESVSEQK